MRMYDMEIPGMWTHVDVYDKTDNIPTMRSVGHDVPGSEDNVHELSVRRDLFDNDDHPLDGEEVIMVEGSTKNRYEDGRSNQGMVSIYLRDEDAAYLVVKLYNAIMEGQDD